MKFPGYGESINNTTSGIFMFYFSLGEMFGPILGSVLVAATGSFVNGIAVLNAVMVIWTLVTLYHLAGYVIFKIKRPEPAQSPEGLGYEDMDADVQNVSEEQAMKDDSSI